jgi:hypothetical protein
MVEPMRELNDQDDSPQLFGFVLAIIVGTAFFLLGFGAIQLLIFLDNLK